MDSCHGVLQLLCDSRRRLCITRIAIFMFFAVFLYQLFPQDINALIISQVSSAACTAEQASGDLSCKANSNNDGTLNVVNLVYVPSNPIEGTFTLQFSHYLSAYAAWYRWRPDTIYLHTNIEANSTAILRAQSGDAGKWAQPFSEIPSLVVNTVPVPNYASNGI